MLIKDNLDAADGGTAYDVKGISFMKVSEERYRLYKDTQQGTILNVGTWNGIFYMNYLMEGMLFFW